MERERHVMEFMQARIDVARRAGHPPSNGEPRTFNPIIDDFVAKSALYLPSYVSRERRHSVLPGERMTRQKIRYVTERREHACLCHSMMPDRIFANAGAEYPG
jgi:hypothetical protein